MNELLEPLGLQIRVRYGNFLFSDAYGNGYALFILNKSDVQWAIKFPNISTYR